ncbi:sensor histidine kinase [Leisingera methylohalidivorans DSM 14336]|uniref:Sensor protein FixL n=2 Tax=Leisingera methylohalidivorans TaxID=133924 RepID=V9VZ16_9RHOB|nr:sensor histidine kinase [Leisingera methylohalidivorans DSM 14336]
MDASRPLRRNFIQYRNHGIALLLLGAGFAFDLLTPLGIAGGLIYVTVVLGALWDDNPNTVYWYAAAATVLTLLAYALLPRTGVNAWIVLSNRGLTILALWALAMQKAAQLSLRRKKTELTAIQDNTVEGMITISTEGTILSYNRACRKIFGYDAEEAIGRNVKFLMPEHYRTEHDGYLSNYLRTGQKKIIGTAREVEGQRKDGSIFPLDLSVSEVRVGGHLLFSGIVRDISEQKRIETEREQFIKDLSRSNQDLDDFAYVASHDLRAPLRVIGNASSWLEEDLADALDDESRENLQLIRSRITRMEQLLNDLHEYSRAGRNTDARYRQLMPGAELMDEVLMLVEQPDGFTINIDPGFASIRLPNMPLKQIFANLVSNAIKHNETGTGVVDVLLEDGGGFYAFTVADDGPGIAPQFHEQIFKMFQTLKSRDVVEGSGMGLAIVKKHVENAGGTITLESSAGEGCAFRFTWPKTARADNG